MIVNAIEYVTLLVAAWILINAAFRGDAIVPAAGCLAVTAGGLLWETFDPWMPPELRTVILRSAVTVLGFAATAVMMSRRSDDDVRAIVALFGSAAVAGVVLRYDLGEFRSMMILAAIVLAVVAAAVGLHIPLARHVLERETKEAAASVHTLWTTGTTWAVLLSCGLVALWLQPMPRWGELLLEVGCTAAGIALLTVSQTIVLMWRHPGFAAAYSVEMSKTILDVRGAMLGGVVLLPPVVALPGIALSLGGNSQAVSSMMWMAGTWVVVGTFRVMRIIRREAIRQRRTAMTGPASTAVRNLAMDDPVYRLLPGMFRKRD
ncbi:hypothetical protein F4560_001111 [Saccharothrix ecbatanensis]|uniref:Uncharacterized protein n=1 Tax=Saccharothrix ecbatanensis TaxID=1105145 RepID=A0A7W9LZ49_9PSEU|nr:hypothetical protein [Saccharothrix ecbatanensis]MBB5801343.1 hypothetical protein [Saccharothrix ecbatanensis]